MPYLVSLSTGRSSTSYPSRSPRNKSCPRNNVFNGQSRTLPDSTWPPTARSHLLKKKNVHVAFYSMSTRGSPRTVKSVQNFVAPSHPRTLALSKKDRRCYSALHHGRHKASLRTRLSLGGLSDPHCQVRSCFSVRNTRRNGPGHSLWRAGQELRRRRCKDHRQRSSRWPFGIWQARRLQDCAIRCPSGGLWL